MKLLKNLILFFALFCLSQPAWAVVNLKKVQVTDGAQVDLLFDGKIAAGQVKTEFFNDIIQLSLMDASVYPARISSVSGSELRKVFAYQYSPKLVRCRLTVSGSAEKYKDKVQVRANGRVVTIRFGAGAADEVVADKVANSASAPARDSRISPEERSLLERVMNSDKPAAKEAQAEKAEKSEKIEKAEKPAATASSKPLTSPKKPLPSPFRSFVMLAMVLALFAGFMFFLKKVRGKSLEKHPALSKLAASFSKLGGRSRGRMIEVVANHYLGPKKNIAVVRVAGRLLVLGVSNESINLITQLQAGSDESSLDLESLAVESALGAAVPAMEHAPVSQGTGAVAAGAPVFSDFLETQSSKPSVRAQIRSRIEGMKPL